MFFDEGLQGRFRRIGAQCDPGLLGGRNLIIEADGVVDEDEIATGDVAPEIAIHGSGLDFGEGAIEFVEAEYAVVVAEAEGFEELVGEGGVGRGSLVAAGGEVEAAGVLEGLLDFGVAIGFFFPGIFGLAFEFWSKGAGVAGIEGEGNVLARDAVEEVFEDGVGNPGIVGTVVAEEAVFGDDGSSASLAVVAMGGNINEELVIGSEGFVFVFFYFIE